MSLFLLAAAAAAAPPVDYGNNANWLCRPGRADACAVPLDATVIPGSGPLKHETFIKAKASSVDCFYVYPTVSLDPTPNSDMVAGAEERAVVASQFARFGSVCRTYAPLYRQVTLTALRQAMSGQANGADLNLGYADVKAAFRSYLAHDNMGRPFVLIGHSQGSRMIQMLVAEEIEGKPVARRMLSAMTPGSNLLVPRGKDVGGTYKAVPLCRRTGQINCAVSYVSFRDTVPPPDGSRFGQTKDQAMEVACTNPAALAGGSAQLDAYLGTSGAGLSSRPAGPWTRTRIAIPTQFVKVPGLLSSRCVSDAAGSYLAITTNADPRDNRTDAISGDVMVGDRVLTDWGLHLIDVSAAQGDLLRIVRQQFRAYASAGR